MWSFIKTPAGIMVTVPTGETHRFIVNKKFHLDTETYEWGVRK
jgi:hypothetical protein